MQLASIHFAAALPGGAACSGAGCCPPPSIQFHGGLRGDCNTSPATLAAAPPPAGDLAVHFEELRELVEGTRPPPGIRNCGFLQSPDINMVSKLCFIRDPNNNIVRAPPWFGASGAGILQNPKEMHAFWTIQFPHWFPADFPVNPHIGVDPSCPHRPRLGGLRKRYVSLWF